MKLRLTSKRFAGFALAVFCLSKASIFAGCGIDWSLPKFHFPDVDEWGYVSFFEKVGSVQMGGKEIPLHIHFLSNRENSSPYAGYGWSVPLLESRIEQVSENGFKLWQPEGRFRDFGRDAKNPNLLHGQAGWKAEIRGDTINAYADCGWKLGFKKGKIVSMGTPDGKNYRYNYESGLVKSIEEVGSSNVVMKVIRNSSDGLVTKLKMGDREIDLEQGAKPRIESINGQNLIGGMDSSLVKITKSNGTVREISYDVDLKNVIPTFIPDKGRVLTINPLNNFVKSDSEWNYTIKQDQRNTWNNAAITRTDSENNREFWHVDNIKGVEKIVDKGSITNTKSWFTSGKLAGRPRSQVQYNEKGTALATTVYSYDEKGRPLREKKVDHKKRLEEAIQYIYYQDDPYLVELKKGDSGVIWVRINKNGQTIEKYNAENLSGIVVKPWDNAEQGFYYAKKTPERITNLISAITSKGREL
ncbi:MAG: hypothetical protein AAF519_10925 [Bacteroidota bacterium]